MPRLESSSRRAVVRIAERSERASGSDIETDSFTFPSISFGSQLAFCSAEPFAQDIQAAEDVARVGHDEVGADLRDPSATITMSMRLPPHLFIRYHDINDTKRLSTKATPAPLARHGRAPTCPAFPAGSI